MKRVIATGLAAVLLLSGCQTGGSGGGGVVIVDNEPTNLDQWVSWINAKLVRRAGIKRLRRSCSRCSAKRTSAPSLRRHAGWWRQRGGLRLRALAVAPSTS